MIKAVIFDVDGTLLNSFEANFILFQKLMEAAGYPLPTGEEYKSIFHRTLHDAIQILAHTNDEKETKRIQDFIEKIDVPPATFSEGVSEVVKTLNEKYLLAIVTSRIKAYAFESPLNTLEHYFKIAVTYEDTELHKPDPEPLLLAAKQLNIEPSECVYIGDVRSDFDAAQAAKMKFILYSQETAEWTSMHTNNFTELPNLIERA
jgi:HAD superfamily hydrolase (TIGR01549 family)